MIHNSCNYIFFYLKKKNDNFFQHVFGILKKEWNPFFNHSERKVLGFHDPFQQKKPETR